MNFYAYIPNERGEEPIGSTNRLIIRNLKTVKGAIKTCKLDFKDKPFKLFTYTNFYKEETFKEIKL